ncbi:DUF5788 family protein [Halodesulfurarchaeum formicicum]|uniref:Uncharacterized protein n=1 Tax=Halodesulfurarchaeum formicicum TaxID=1873524 RepID=A0A1J1ACN5_9EURY|nr:DUF5788 family protein [Halodesulfurarchaeum formicicum]APE95922.1 hypothetical protein HSR6_1479 [Halodesulfurarchaeum formicicum]
MQDYERERLLERIDREGATVGASIPDSLEVNGEQIDLAAFVLDARGDGPEPSAEEVQSLIRELRGERKRRRAKIETGEISRDRGERLAESILGIDRALTALESDADTDLEAEARRRKRADQKRWRSFLDSATGEDENRGGRRGNTW